MVRALAVVMALTRVLDLPGTEPNALNTFLVPPILLWNSPQGSGLEDAFIIDNHEFPTRALVTNQNTSIPQALQLCHATWWWNSSEMRCLAKLKAEHL